MAQVTVDISEYDSLRDALKESKERVKELKETIKDLRKVLRLFSRLGIFNQEIILMKLGGVLTVSAAYLMHKLWL